MTLYHLRSSTTLSSDTTKNLDLTVPSGKIWRVHRVNMLNGDDVSRDVRVQIRDSSGNLIHKVGGPLTLAAGASGDIIPYLKTAPDAEPGAITILVKGGYNLRLIWAAGGASSGGTAYYSITYEEIPE